MPGKKRLSRESRTVEKMIHIYCLAHHGTVAEHLCPACLEIQQYAFERIQRCPFGLRKPTCAKCHVHCYRPDKREQIRRIMRYAGPRMLYHHPILTIQHLFDGLKKPQKK